MTMIPNDENDPAPASDELTKEEIADFIQRLEQMQEDVLDMQATHKPLMEGWLRGLAGPLLDELRESSEKTLSYFRDTRPSIRRAAIYLAVEHWELREQVVPKLEEMATTDVDDDVREGALGAIGTCYLRTADPRIGKFLASIVHDKTLPNRIRVRAYSALVHVHRFDLSEELISPGARSIEEVNWEFVARYYRT